MKIFRRQRAHGATWYGRFRDPISRKHVDVNLTEGGLTTIEERLRWAKDKSAELVLAKRARALGQRPRLARVELLAAVQAYLDDCRARLRPSTVKGYEQALEAWRDWIERRGRKSMQEVTPEDLWAYRSATVQRNPTPRTATSHLTRVQTALHWFRRAGYVPLLNSDAIDDACKDLPAPRPKPVVLKPAELRTLLVAAVEPLGPLGRGHVVGSDGAAFLAVMILTGMRLGEAEQLRWAQVDLEAAPGGAIQLGVETKTHRARTIDLDVSPALHELLAALPRAGPFVFGTEEPIRARRPLDPAKKARSGPQPLSRQIAQRRWQAGLQVLERAWTWKDLRSTAGTYLTCAPSIWGAGAMRLTAAQLGHSVSVCETHYAGVLRGISPQARTLEAAMEIEHELEQLLALIRGRGS